jgi:hypothetical protein
MVQIIIWAPTLFNILGSTDIKIYIDVFVKALFDTNLYLYVLQISRVKKAKLFVIVVMIEFVR